MRLSFKLILIAVIIIAVSAVSAQEIKPGVNFLKSAVVPGWGQLSLQKNYGFAFLAGEIAFWSLNYYYNQETDNNEDASFKYAVKYAELDPMNSYDEQFYSDMRNYSSSGYDDGGYNAYIVEKAASLYPDDLQQQQDYITAHIYDEDHHWNWSSEEHQGTYSGYRRNIDQYSDYLKLVAGVIAANHIISAVDALRLSNHIKKVRFGVDLNSENIPLLTCTYKF